MKKIRWGMIGCGDVTEHKSGPAFQKIEGSELVAVMRRTASKAEDYAHRHNVARWYDDAVKLINDPDVDIVYIATPPGSHLEYTLKVAEAGKPVYVEKPMAINYSQCQQMIEACESANVPLWVAYYRRAMPPFVKIKQILENGAIGQPWFVNIQLYYSPRKEDYNKDNLPWRVMPEISGGGYFVDMAVHQLDFLDYIFGPVIKVSGNSTNKAGLYQVEDTITANFEFESGVIGAGSWCFAVPAGNETDKIEIIGSKGKVTFSTFAQNLIIIETDNNTQQIKVEWPQHVHQPLVQTIIDEIQGKGQCPSTGITAARTSGVVDEILNNN